VSPAPQVEGRGFEFALDLETGPGTVEGGSKQARIASIGRPEHRVRRPGGLPSTPVLRAIHAFMASSSSFRSVAATGRSKLKRWLHRQPFKESVRNPSYADPKRCMADRSHLVVEDEPIARLLTRAAAGLAVGAEVEA